MKEMAAGIQEDKGRRYHERKREKSMGTRIYFV
jgi:hypothetical protein